MGFLDRIGKIATGIGGALQAPVGLVYDLARAPFVDDDDLDGFVNVLYGRTVARGGQLFGNVLGPSEGLGAAIGGLPGAVRRPVRTVLDPVFAGLETAGREVIREPLTALMTAASLQQAGEGFDLGEGYRIAQDRSLGQAVALALLTDDITDETEIAKASGSDWYGAISGTTDALARLFMEPDVLIGDAHRLAKVAGAGSRTTRVLTALPGTRQLVGRGTYGSRIRTTKDLDAALVHPAMSRINDQITDIRDQAPDVATAAARIRDLAFHDHRDGAVIATVLAEADDLPTVWGALMGQRSDIDRLAESRADIAGRIDRLVGTQARIANLKRSGFELPREVKDLESSLLNREIDALYDTEARLLYEAGAEATVTRLPRISRTSEVRRSATRSDFYQQSPWAAPLRLATNMRPRPMVDLHDPAGDIQVSRILRKARVADDLQDSLRGEYMAAPDPTARQAVLARAEATAIRTVAERHGVDPDSIEQIITQAAKNRDIATSSIAQSRKFDGAGRSYIEDVGDDGVISKIYLPVAATQEFNHYLLANLDELDSIFKEAGEKAAHLNMPVRDVLRGGVRGGNELLERFNRIWKPSVLLRVGWPIRVVGEEQLRIMSQIGALLTVGRTSVAGARYGKDLVADLVTRASESVRRIPRDERALRDPKLRGVRLGTMDVNGWEMQKAFGTPEEPARISLQLNSAKGSLDPMFGVADHQLNELRKNVTGEWQSIDPTDKSWGQAWEHAVNAQIGQDAMWRQFLSGKTVDEVAEWTNTAEGRAYLRRVPHWKNRVDDWLEVAKQTVDDYLPTDDLRLRALEGRARADDIIGAIPDAAGRPVVHGAVLTDITGQTAFMREVGKVRDTAMRVLGTLPTDVLSRQPYFDWHYTAEVKRLVNLAGEQGVDYTPDLARTFEKQARSYALGESKKLLYDLAESSELAHILRFISPFYSAWQEVLTRWTGIATDNPAFVLRMQEVWRSPERAGLVTDENGNQISADGESATSPLGDKVEPGEERFITFGVPKWAVNDLTKHIPGVRGLEAQGGVKLNKDGFNTILQGLPGVGPLVQIPVNQIAKSRPELEESLRWALPFGATQSTLDMLLPATAKRIKTKAGGEEERLYRNTLIRLYYDSIVDYNLGKRGEKPTFAEAKKKADAFYNMRTVASFISPVAPSFTSPYQPYIDTYRALKEKDPRTADEVFLAQYGSEYFPLTQSLSRSMDGVPPTLEGAAARKKYIDLIEKHPEFGGLITGAEGAGEFVSSVYQAQLQNPVRPGSLDKQRQALTFEEAAGAPEKRQAWIGYTRVMDLLEAERIKRGLPNFQVKAAQDLSSIKRQFIEQHAQKFPDWYADFSVVDRNAWNRRLVGLREIAADDRLAGREEIQGLRRYLEVRDAFVAELGNRKISGGSRAMSASSNLDLAGLWAQATGKLVESSLPFSDLFYRYLERDPMTPEPSTVTVSEVA